VLLLFPDHATAARTLAEGELGAGPDGDDRPGGTIMCGGLLIDPLRQDVAWNGIPLQLTRLERAVLTHLAEPPMRAWSYENLYCAAWGDNWLGDTSALHATVKRLRRKLRDAGVTIFLESIRGVGFRLDTAAATAAVPAPGAVPAPADVRPARAVARHDGVRHRGPRWGSRRVGPPMSGRAHPRARRS
jgi:DNA-binding winged helix-turn-helix (wHTH) protein